MLFFLVICFGFSAICFYGLSAAQKPRTPGTRLMSVVGMCVEYIFVYLTVQGIQKLTVHSSSLSYYFALGVGLRGESTSTNMWTQHIKFPCALAADFLSLLVLLRIVLSFALTVGVNKNRRLKFRKAGSSNWTRRRAYWIQKSVCRADYLAFARRSKTLAAKSFKIKGTHTSPNLEQATTSKSVPILDSVVASKETRVRRRLLKRRDLHVCRRAPSKPFPFFYTPKRIKKRMGFRRRTSNAMDHRIVPLRGEESKSKKPRSAPRTNKQRCQPKRPKLRKQTSVPEVKHKPPPSYHVPYTKALEAYKTLRKGKTFHANKKVI